MKTLEDIELELEDLLDLIAEQEHYLELKHQTIDESVGTLSEALDIAFVNPDDVDVSEWEDAILSLDKDVHDENDIDELEHALHCLDIARQDANTIEQELEDSNNKVEELENLIEYMRDFDMSVIQDDFDISKFRVFQEQRISYIKENNLLDLEQHISKL